MLIYVFVFAISYSMFYLYSKSNYKELACLSAKSKRKISNNIFYLFCCAPMVLLSALRYGFGPDYNGTYKYIFSEVNGKSSGALDILGLSGNNAEVAFTLLNKVVGYFTDTHIYVLFFSAVLALIPIFFGIRKNSKYLFLSLILFLISGAYFESMCAIRQYLAMVFFVFAIPYLENRNLKKYLIFIFMGSLFHSSVLFMIPIYFLYNVKLNLKSTFILVASVVLGSGIISLAIQAIIGIIPKYSKYLMTITEKSDAEIGLILIFAIASVVGYITRKKDKSLNFFFTIMVISLCCSIACTNIGYLERFLLFSKMVLVIYLPLSLKKLPHGYLKEIVCIGVYGVLFSNFVYTTFIGNWYFAVPYKSIFDIL